MNKDFRGRQDAYPTGKKINCGMGADKMPTPQEKGLIVGWASRPSSYIKTRSQSSIRFKFHKINVLNRSPEM